jgi:ribosomal protein S18 acetylase RimI-like enzyme
MLKIRNSKIEDIPSIVEIAYNTWFKTYENIISKEQIDFMFGEMYTPEAIYKQIDFLGHRFLIAEENGVDVGFASFSEMLHENIKTAKVHKLYFLPSTHKKGYGKMMLSHIEELLSKENYHFLILNVNRNNPAFQFYQKLNYSVRESIDIPYGNYILNDYVMEKNISTFV